MSTTHLLELARDGNTDIVRLAHEIDFAKREAYRWIDHLTELEQQMLRAQAAQTAALKMLVEGKRAGES